MSANILVNSQTLSVDVNTSTNTINVSSTPNTVELNLEPKLTLTQIRNNFFANSPLVYDSATGTFSLDEDAIDPIVVDSIQQSNVKLKHVSETVFDAGTVANVAVFDFADGTIQTATVTDDITDIQFANTTAGSSITLVLTQDAIGGHNLETGLLSDWNFVDQNTDLDLDPLSVSTLSVFYTGNSFVATLTTFDPLTTDDLTEGNSNLYYTDARARGAISVQSPILYDQANGVISIDQSSLGPADTDELAEGNTNLYFTVDRVRSNISASGNILYDNNTGVISESLTTTDIDEGDNLYFTTQRARDSISATAPIEYDSGNGVLSIDQSALFSGKTTDDLAEGNTNLYYTNSRVQSLLDTGVVDALFTGDVVIQGNLEVFGNVDYVTVEDLLVKDHEIVLNFGNAAAQDAFITVDRSGSSLANAQIRWNESTDAWEFSNDGVNYQPIPTSTTDLSEGTNLYYTDARARDAISASGNIVYDSNTGVISESLTTTDIDEGDNLYYTDARANSAIGAYQGDINTTGNISAGVFFGDGGNLSNIDTGANLATSTTDDLSEGNTNLYYTDTRANSAIDARVDSAYINSLTIDATNTNVDANAFSGLLSTADDTAQKAFATLDSTTTDDVSEGTSNKYYTDTRARDAISSGDTNIDYANGVLTLSNTLSNVDTITSSANTLLSLNNIDDQGREIEGVVVDNPGWAYSGYNLPFVDQRNWFSNAGNANLLYYTAELTTTTGSNVISVTGVFTVEPDASPAQGASVDELQGSIFAPSNQLDSYLTGSPVTINGQPFPFRGAAVVVSTDSSNTDANTGQIGTITVSDTAISNVTMGFATATQAAFYPCGYDADNDTALIVVPQYTGQVASDPTLVSTVSTIPITSYKYPRTGFTPDDFDWSVGDANTFVFDQNILSDRMIARVRMTPAGSAPNFTRGFTVGADTQLTNRGLTEQIQSFGVNIMWDGKGEDFPQAWQDNPSSLLGPQILLNTFSDKTFTDGAGRLFFQSFTGNTSVTQSEQYPRSGQGLGRVQWGGATQNQYLNVSTVTPSAALQAYAATDWIDRGAVGAIAGNTNVYLNATTNNQAGNDLFLSFDGGELFLASGTHGTTGAQPISLGPARSAGANPVGVYTDTSPRWATVNYSNTSAQSGAEFAITNGGSVENVGDMVFAMDRQDNSGNVVTKWTSPFNAKIFNQGAAGVPTTFIAVTAFLPGLSTGDPVIIDNADSPVGEVLNGNELYVEQSSAPVTSYRLWGNPELDQAVVVGANSASPDATIEFNAQSGVSAKTYSFRLAEQSNDLEILVDGSLHSTIKANGEIHNAAGSKYITETDFDTLFDARIAAQFPTLLQDNAALIQQIAGGNVEPDYDGGSASTATFDFTVDGGDATTTEFTDTVDGGDAGGNVEPDYDGGSASTATFDFTVTGGDATTTEFTDSVEGGNAEGNSIVEGGFSSTTVYASTEDGGNASTTEFDQTINGGNA